MASLATGLTKYTRRNFTLLELICVMAISALLVGLIIGRVGKVPAYLSFKNALSNISNVLDEASNQSELTGKKVVILYDDAELYPKNDELKRSVSYLSYKIPPFVDVSFNDNSPDNKQFVFFPDGSSSGPDMKFSFKGHIASLKLSKLTGQPVITTND